MKLQNSKEVTISKYMHHHDRSLLSLVDSSLYKQDFIARCSPPDTNPVSTRSISREMLCVADPHHDFERTVRDIFSTKSHVDDIGSWLWCGVEDVKGSILVLDDLCFHLSPIRCDNDARDLPFPCTFCVHHKAHLFSDADGRPDARTCKIRIGLKSVLRKLLEIC